MLYTPKCIMYVNRETQKIINQKSSNPNYTHLDALLAVHLMYQGEFCAMAEKVLWKCHITMKTRLHCVRRPCPEMLSSHTPWTVDRQPAPLQWAGQGVLLSQHSAMRPLGVTWRVDVIGVWLGAWLMSGASCPGHAQTHSTSHHLKGKKYSIP